MVREAFFDFDGCGTPISSISLSYRQFAQLRFDSGVQRATIRQMPWRRETLFGAAANPSNFGGSSVVAGGNPDLFVTLTV
jgi:hypothetical protein